MRRLASPGGASTSAPSGAFDRVAVAGSVIGLVSLIPGWFNLRPSRIANGSDVSLWDGAGWPITAALLLLWLVCLAAGIYGRGRLKAAVLGGGANLVVVAALLIAGWASGRLLEGQSETARVSLGAGFWLTLAAAYVVIHASRQRLAGWGFRRNVVALVGPVVLVVLFAGGWLNETSIVREFSGREDRFLQELRQHVVLFAGSVAVGTLLGIALGIWATRSRRAERPIFFITNITQTIPSLARFGLLIAPLSELSFAFPFLRELGIRGVGMTPAMIALVVYSLLPIARNTFVGLRQVDPAAVDAGLGLGMSRRQVFRKIEAPLAAPVVLEGVRIAAVQAVGLAAVAAFIGAGGLGWFILRGAGQQAVDLILVGALPIVVLALVVDGAMRGVIRLATPRGVLRGAA